MTTGEYYQVARWLSEERPKDEEGATVGEKRIWLAVTAKLARGLRETYCTTGDRNKFHALADPSGAPAPPEASIPVSPPPVNEPVNPFDFDVEQAPNGRRDLF